MNRILVIDDDVELCELLTDYLVPEGFDVETVHNSNKGIERALSGDHDFVVLDIMLPDGSGLDLLGSLRSRNQTTPVILLTARDTVDDRITGR